VDFCSPCTVEQFHAGIICVNQEAQFEKAVRQTAYEERQNQLRWQVRQGDELPTLEFQVKVIDDRLEDWKIYKV